MLTIGNWLCIFLLIQPDSKRLMNCTKRLIDVFVLKLLTKSKNKVLAYQGTYLFPINVVDIYSDEAITGKAILYLLK